MGRVALPLVICDGCRRQFPLNVLERRLEAGVIDVGSVCLHCGAWQHSFFTNPTLKELQEKLVRYRRSAHRGEQFLARYERLKAEYQLEHDQFNNKVAATRVVIQPVNLRDMLGKIGIGGVVRGK